MTKSINHKNQYKPNIEIDKLLNKQRIYTQKAISSLIENSYSYVCLHWKISFISRNDIYSLHI